MIRISPNKVGLLVSLSILIAVVCVLSSPQARTSALLLGDFPAFYCLAKIADSEQSSEIYNLNLQTEIQNKAWPELDGGVLISVYPPAVAMTLLPLARLPASQAHIIFTALSITALFASFWILLIQHRDYSKWKFAIFGLIIANPFILLGTLGGQNTAFSLLIISSGIYLLNLSSKDKRYELLSGLILSLWLLKPQYGLSIIPFLLIFRLKNACLGYLSGFIIHYLAGVYLIGWHWPAYWLKSISEFAAINYSSNQDIHTSLLSLITLANSYLRVISSDMTSLITFLAFPAMAIGICLILRYSKSVSSFNMANKLSLYVAAFPLLIPQAQFYDIGIAAYIFLNMSLSTKAFPLKTSLLLWAISWLSILLRSSAGALLFPIVSSIYLYYSYKNTLPINDLSEHSAQQEL